MIYQTRLERQRTAVHEAGHAIAATYYGCRDVRISMAVTSETPARSGAVLFDQSEMAPGSLMTLSLAGAAAEQLYLPFSCIEGSVSDAAAFDELMVRDECFANARTLTVVQCFANALGLLVSYRKPLLALAEALMERDALSSDEVTAIVGGEFMQEETQGELYKRLVLERGKGIDHE